MLHRHKAYHFSCLPGYILRAAYPYCYPLDSGLRRNDECEVTVSRFVLRAFCFQIRNPQSLPQPFDYLTAPLSRPSHITHHCSSTPSFRRKPESSVIMVVRYSLRITRHYSPSIVFRHWTLDWSYPIHHQSWLFGSRLPTAFMSSPLLLTP